MSSSSSPRRCSDNGSKSSRKRCSMPSLSSGESPAKRQASACTGRSKASRASIRLASSNGAAGARRSATASRKRRLAWSPRRKCSTSRTSAASQGGAGGSPATSPQCSSIRSSRPSLAQRWRARASMSADRSAATKRQPGRNPASSASSPPAPQPTLSRRARSGRRASNCARLSRCSNS